MALVPQDVALFDDTVTENIRYGPPEAGDAEVRAGRQGRPGRRLHLAPWTQVTQPASASAA